jgi:hypothetical protein
LRYLEPFCDRTYIEDSTREIYSQYVENVQEDTEFELSKRVFNISSNDPEAENDVVVEMDMRALTEKDYQILPILSRVLNQIEQPGIYQLENLTIKVNTIATYEREYITLENREYLSKLKNYG